MPKGTFNRGGTEGTGLAVTAFVAANATMRADNCRQRMLKVRLDWGLLTEVFFMQRHSVRLQEIKRGLPPSIVPCLYLSKGSPLYHMADEGFPDGACNG